MSELASESVTRGEDELEISLVLNGTPTTREVAAELVLADFLRAEGATSVRVSCDQGVCGACTVLVDDQPVASCSTFVFQVDGQEVTTVEGLRGGPDPHPVQRAFADNFALQCGYCTPGMVLTAEALLRREPRPSADQVRRWMAGNICRCTGYVPIVEAVLAASENRDETGSPR